MGQLLIWMMPFFLAFYLFISFAAATLRFDKDYSVNYASAYVLLHNESIKTGQLVEYIPRKYVKYVLGVAGDQVRIDKHAVYINEQQVSYSPIPLEKREYTIPKGRVYLGSAHPRGHDSRFFGTVKSTDCVRLKKIL